MAKLSAIASDIDKEVNGVRVHYEMGIYVTIARSGNAKYRARLAELMDPHREDIRSGKADNKLYDEILRRARAECILLGWENIDDDEGRPVPYSSEEAFRIFSDPRFKDFYLFVVRFSEDALNFRASLIKESEGNLKSTSDGSKSGVRENLS